MPSEAVFKALARSEVVREWIEAFHKATGLTIKLVSADPSAMLPAPSSRENPFCTLVTETYAGREAYEQPRLELQSRLANELVPHTTQCFAGFMHVAVPLVVGGKHVATLLVGQVLPCEPTSRLFRSVRERLRKLGFDDELRRLQKAWFKTPVIPTARFVACVRALELSARFLGECAERWTICGHEKDPLSIARAKEFIEQHVNDALGLEDVTAYVHLSPQYFCKLFKKTTGLSFKQYLSRVRVERAKQLLLDPSVRIKEVASGTGFGSLRRFEEVFLAHTGLSACQFRAKFSRS